MSSKNKQILQKNHEVWKSYKFEHGVVKIEIKLRTDIKDHLKSSLEIIPNLVREIEEDLKKLDV